MDYTQHALARHLPQDNMSIMSATGKQTAIRAKDDGYTHLGMPLQTRHTLLALQIPQKNRLTFIAGASQQIAAGMKAHGTNPVGMPGEQPYTATRLKLPKCDSALDTGTGQQPTIGRIAEGEHIYRAIIQGVQTFAGREMPHENAKRIATCQLLAAGVKGQCPQPGLIADKFLYTA